MVNADGFETLLSEMWQEIALKIATLLNSDRATLFLVDKQAPNEFWSIIVKPAEGKNSPEIRLGTERGLVQEVAISKKSVNIPFDFYDDPRLESDKTRYEKIDYRPYTMLVLPLTKEDGNLIGVVQVVNKLKLQEPATASLLERIDTRGFTQADEDQFAEKAPEIQPLLEKCLALCEAIQQEKAASSLLSATRSLSQNNLDLDQIFQLASDGGKQIANADRCVLWLIDRDRHQLWTKTSRSGAFKKIHIPQTAGFAGKVVQSNEPLIIAYDLYEHPDSADAKRTDRKFRYRTCSLLCLPVFNPNRELIGVTQLINKKQSGEFTPYNPDEWPQIPEIWKASFNRFDRAFIEDFNILIGAAVENARRFGALARHEQLQREIMGGLNNGIIYTDKIGRIQLVNDRAQQLLGFGDGEIALVGKSIRKLVKLEDGEFVKWFSAALEGTSQSDRQQYHPEQSLISAKGEQYIINLSIKSIYSGGTPSSILASHLPENAPPAGAISGERQAINIGGVLLVMDDITEQKLPSKGRGDYILSEVVQPLPQGESRMEGERRDVSILFAGIRRFTSLLENLEDREILQLLKEYFESMTEAVFKHQGTIDKYIGDAIMAIFGLDKPLEDRAWYAVQTAVEMRQRLMELNVRRVENGKPAIQIGIGINSDTAIAGNIGSSHHMEYTVIGDSVNLAAQLEEESKRYGRDIIISENTYRFCADRIWARELDLIRLKDTNQPVAIYELVGLRSEEIPSEKRKAIEYYSQGRKYYRARQFDLASVAFSQVLEISNWDKAAAIHQERCQYFLQEPPPENWDGVWASATPQEPDA